MAVIPPVAGQRHPAVEFRRRRRRRRLRQRHRIAQLYPIPVEVVPIVNNEEPHGKTIYHEKNENFEIMILYYFWFPVTYQKINIS